MQNLQLLALRKCFLKERTIHYFVNNTLYLFFAETGTEDMMYDLSHDDALARNEFNSNVFRFSSLLNISISLS